MCIELGTAKAQPAAEYALELLPGCEKLLFFAHHKVPPPPPPRTRRAHLHLSASL